MSDPRQVMAGAVTHYQAGRFDAAGRELEAGLRTYPDEPNLLQMLGIIRLTQDRAAEAVQIFTRVRARVGDAPALLSNLGKAYAAEKVPAKAAECHAKAVSLAPNIGEYQYNHGNALLALGKSDEALASYRRAIALKPDFAQAHYNIGTLLQKRMDLPGAETAFRAALRARPDYHAAHMNLGTTLLAQGKAEGAIASYEAALALASDDAESYYNLANALAAIDRLALSAEVSEKGLARFPRDSLLLSLHMHTVRRMCQWPGTEKHEAALRTAALDPSYKGTIFPLLSLFDDPALHLKAASSFARNELPLPKRPVFPPRQPGRVRIGYVSADFNVHVMAHLFAGLFELHDREKFEIWGISIGRDDGSAIRKRLVASFDHFIDITTLSDEAAAQKIRGLSLDIAVDLNGYTQHNRAGLFAHRLAPTQVYYLIPGTTGAPFLDYILLDKFVAPAEQQINYAETIVYLPGCYWINDTTISVADNTPTRAALGLPEDGFVFCSFSNNYKITPQIFDVWMRLLQGQPGSVLWLLADNPWAERNLRAEAQRRGVAPERIVFAPRAPRPDHLARHRLADLGLDTFPYNGHTTVSDAMWTGLPVVTLAGESFAARVAGSMLLTADLGELITTSLADYEQLAGALRGARLEAVRQKLEANRNRASLFDTRGKTREIEAAYLALLAKQKR